MISILFIEDDDGKAARVEEFVSMTFDDARVTRMRSFNSGLRSLADRSSKFDLVLLDMTMPLFDSSPSTSGASAPEQLAGRDLLAQMKLRRITVPTIIVSMHDRFGEGVARKSLKEITDELKENFSPTYAGVVYYNATEEHWKSELKNIMSSVIRELKK